MKAVTLHQPYATLISAGLKTIETRSWPTRHRGPVAVHAAAKRPRAGEWGSALQTWVGDYRLISKGDRVVLDGAAAGETTLIDVPFGAVVAVANLTDCVPMVELELGDGPGGRHVAIEGLTADWTITVQPDGTDKTDEKHYGQYAGGRWAWLLEDIRPVDPIPVKGAQRLWNWEIGGCETCEPVGTIPADAPTGSVWWGDDSERLEWVGHGLADEAGYMTAYEDPAFDEYVGPFRPDGYTLDRHGDPVCKTCYRHQIAAGRLP